MLWRSGEGGEQRWPGRVQRTVINSWIRSRTTSSAHVDASRPAQLTPTEPSARTFPGTSPLPLPDTSPVLSSPRPSKSHLLPPQPLLFPSAALSPGTALSIAFHDLPIHPDIPTRTIVCFVFQVVNIHPPFSSHPPPTAIVARASSFRPLGRPFDRSPSLLLRFLSIYLRP